MSGGATMIGLDELTARFNALGNPEEAVGTALVAVGDVVEARAKTNVQKQGLILEGRLRSAIQRRKLAWNEVIVGVFDVIYAAIHEFGGVIKAKNAPYLWFKTKSGDWVRTKSVTIPARPYLRPAIYENPNELAEIFAAVMRRLMLK